MIRDEPATNPLKSQKPHRRTAAATFAPGAEHVVRGDGGHSDGGYPGAFGLRHRAGHPARQYPQSAAADCFGTLGPIGSLCPPAIGTGGPRGGANPAGRTAAGLRHGKNHADRVSQGSGPDSKGCSRKHAEHSRDLGSQSAGKCARRLGAGARGLVVCRRSRFSRRAERIRISACRRR